MREASYCLYKNLPSVDLEHAIQRVTAALQAEGFGILTEIDVQATLKKKLDVDTRPYRILGACNPHLAHRALSADDTIGLLLPCNVVVAETGNGSEVGILRPEAMFQLVEAASIRPVAEEAQQRLQRVLDSL